MLGDLRASHRKHQYKKIHFTTGKQRYPLISCSIKVMMLVARLSLPATKPQYIATMATQAFGTVEEMYAQISANASTACRVLWGLQPQIAHLLYPVTVAKLQNGQY